jgi:alpha-methylacyl-CoA racemase
VTGPLTGVKVVELAGLGPAPLACMVLADLGAEVVRVDRPGGGTTLVAPEYDLLTRGRPSVAVDLKSAEGVEVIRRLVARSDVLVEGFRPGVAERLGLGPEISHDRLVYARMTGWGQDGPWAGDVGHDITYLAVTGGLHAVGESGRPVPPLNLVADFGGGSMLLVTGVLAALVERATSGRGQVVDAAMVDGVSLLLAMTRTFRNGGVWQDRREANLLDGGAPFYRCYRTRDELWVAVGAIEPQFYAALLAGLESVIPGCTTDLPGQLDLGRWPELIAALDAIFAERTRAQWTEVFSGSDACVAPVLSLDEAPDHPHLAARSTLVPAPGVDPARSWQPAVAPRFSRTPGSLSTGPRPPGADTTQALGQWGFSAAEIDALLAAGTVVQG